MFITCVSGTLKKDGPQKRQLGRYPRIPFTNQQIFVLEEKFQLSPYLSSEEAVELSRKLQLAVVKIKIWFQNRRARKRREELESIRPDNSMSVQKEVNLKSAVDANHSNGGSSKELPKEIILQYSSTESLVSTKKSNKQV